jgi:protocatechuate 3,4-dioxygenase beta subunit
VRSAVLDARGHALVADLPPRALTVQAVPAGSEWPEWVTATVRPNATEPVVIRLTEGEELRGRVVDARTKAPIAGARVGAPRWFGSGVTTDQDGSFVIRSMSQGFGLLHVHAAGYADAKVDVRAGAEEITSPVTIELVPGRSLSGRVIDAQGAPVAGAYVAASGHAWRDRFMQADWVGTRSDALGRFELADLDASLSHELIARKDGFGAAVFDLPTYEVESERVDVGDIVLRPPARIDGRVLGDDGQAIRGMRVVLDGTNADRGALPGAQRQEVDPVQSDRHVTTDDLGRFAFTDVAAGAYELRAESDDHQLRSERIALRIESGERRTDVDLHRLAAQTLRGRVRAADGQPLAATLRLVPVGPHERSIGLVSEKDGSFEVRDLQPGAYDLVVDPDEGAPITLRVSAGSQAIDVRLPENDPVRGHVRDAQGRPLARAWVQLVDATCEQSLSACESKADGSFVLPLGRGAHARLQAVSRKQADGTKLRAVIEDVASGSDLDVKLVVPP